MLLAHPSFWRGLCPLRFFFPGVEASHEQQLFQDFKLGAKKKENPSICSRNSLDGAQLTVYSGASRLSSIQAHLFSARIPSFPFSSFRAFLPMEIDMRYYLLPT